MIRCTCPHCSAVHVLDNRLIGQVLACHECNHQLYVPFQRAVAKSPPLTRDQPYPPLVYLSHPAERRWAWLAVPFIGFVAVLLLVAAVDRFMSSVYPSTAAALAVCAATCYLSRSWRQLAAGLGLSVAVMVFTAILVEVLNGDRYRARDEAYMKRLDAMPAPSPPTAPR